MTSDKKFELSPNLINTPKINDDPFEGDDDDLNDSSDEETVLIDRKQEAEARQLREARQALDLKRRESHNVHKTKLEELSKNSVSTPLSPTLKNYFADENKNSATSQPQHRLNLYCLIYYIGHADHHLFKAVAAAMNPDVRTTNSSRSKRVHSPLSESTKTISKEEGLGFFRRRIRNLMELNSISPKAKEPQKLSAADATSYFNGATAIKPKKKDGDITQAIEKVIDAYKYNLFSYEFIY